MSSQFDPIASCPTAWAKQLKPFLVKCSEFQQRNPAVAYYLKTYVAFVAMRLRKTIEDKEGTKWLMSLLTSLETDKAKLSDTSSDGRTILTRTALMLFTRADDMERTGEASEATVRLFFTSSLLFEATKQFTDNGELDPIAAEKSKYAKYTAAAIKRALENGVPYVSPNPQEAALPAADGGVEQPPPPPAQPAQPPPPPAQPAQPPPPGIGAFSTPWDAPPMNPTWYNTPEPAVPPYYQPPQQPQQQQPQQPQQPWQQPQQQPQPQPQQQPWQPQQPQPQQQQQPQPQAAGVVPTMNEMIESQKFAKQAVSALQFYDYQNAKVQLRSALRALGDQP